MHQLLQMAMMVATTGTNPFEEVSKPIISLLNLAITPALGIVGEQSTVSFWAQSLPRRRSLRTGRRPKTA